MLNNIAKVLQNELQSSPQTGDLQYKIFDFKDTMNIYQLYQSYDGCAEFLYIPSPKEIHQHLISDKSCYFGAQTQSGELVSVSKIEQLEVPSPFFVPPKYEAARQAPFFGLSGMLVAKKYRQKGIAGRTTAEAVKALSKLNAAGVYADCDYRNLASFSTLSSVLDFAGYTDGRQGAESEKTIYTTFYKSFSKEPSKLSQVQLDFSCQNLENADACLQSEMTRIAPFSCHTIAYGGGKNKFYIFDEKIYAPQITLTLEKNKPIVLKKRPLLTSMGRQNMGR